MARTLCIRTFGALAITVSLAGGCSHQGQHHDAASTSEAGEGDEVVSGETSAAPEASQRACIAEVASQYGAAQDQIVPGSSRSTGNDTYEITVSFGDRTAVCTVDRMGNVRFLQEQ